MMRVELCVVARSCGVMLWFVVMRCVSFIVRCRCVCCWLSLRFVDGCALPFVAVVR